MHAFDVFTLVLGGNKIRPEDVDLANEHMYWL